MKYVPRFGDGGIQRGNTPLRNRWDTFKYLAEDEVVELLKSADVEKESRNWLERPEDLVSLIFAKLGPIQILCRAQFVCCLWQNLSKQPHLFRSLDLRKPFTDSKNRLLNNYNWTNSFLFWENLASVAFDRSNGQLVEFYIEDFGTDDLLRKILDKSSSLKHICLASCNKISREMLIEFVRKSPSIEQFEFINCYFLDDVIIAEIGRCCSQLTKFRLDYYGDRYYLRSYTANEVAFAIVKNVPGVHSLHLVGNFMSNEGLDAILDGCLHFVELRTRKIATKFFKI